MQVDLGLTSDSGERFALWAILHTLGSSPDLDAVSQDPSRARRRPQFHGLAGAQQPAAASHPRRHRDPAERRISANWRGRCCARHHAHIGPSSDGSLSAAASDSAPAPSAIVRDFSAIRRIGSAVRFSVTVIAPSVTGRYPLPYCSVTLFPPATVDEASPASRRTFCGPPLRSDERGARRLRLRAEYLRIRPLRFDCVPMPVISPPPLSRK